MEIIFQIAILIFSVVIHEVSHGMAALYLGDPTAKYEGRLTLNPIKHLDMFGSIILPLMLVLVRSPVLFAWAKPVPYNPYNLRDQKWGPAFVGAAGPISNVVVALVFGLLVRFAEFLPFLPVAFFQIASFIVFLNLILAIFNLIPIPPLDGSKVLFALMPINWLEAKYFLERYGLFILIFFIFFFSGAILPVALFLFRLITGVSF